MFLKNDICVVINYVIRFQYRHKKVQVRRKPDEKSHKRFRGYCHKP